LSNAPRNFLNINKRELPARNPASPKLRTRRLHATTNLPPRSTTSELRSRDPASLVRAFPHPVFSLQRGHRRRRRFGRLFGLRHNRRARKRIPKRASFVIPKNDFLVRDPLHVIRSEERRVGKECRYQWTPPS